MNNLNHSKIIEKQAKKNAEETIKNFRIISELIMKRLEQNETLIYNSEK